MAKFSFWWRTFLLAGLLVLADLLSKNYFLQFELGQKIWQQGPFHLALQMNQGIAFSLPLKGILLVFVLALVMLTLVYFFYQHIRLDNWWSVVVLSLLIGGASGNIIDRLRFGAVVDFIGVGSFPLFNLADSAITISALCLILFWSKLVKG